MEKKAVFFWNELSNPAEDPKNFAETWKPGKLRRVRAMNDLYKAVTKPSLCPSQDYVGWEVPEHSSDDDALMEILKNENYEESVIVTEPFF